jgi:hypothetical protein
MAITAQTPDILGERQSGQDVRTQNGNSSLPLLQALPRRQIPWSRGGFL